MTQPERHAIRHAIPKRGSMTERQQRDEIEMGRAPFSEPGGWRWSETKDKPRRDVVRPELTERDNPVTKTLYGPDGKPIRQFTERPKVPFGYHGRGDA